MALLETCPDCGTEVSGESCGCRDVADPVGGRPAPAGGDPYRELFERSADAILIIEGDRFIDCNQATVDMLGYANREELLQTHPSELSPEKQPDGRPSFEKANELMTLAFEQGSQRFEWDHVRANGEVFPVEVLLTAVQEPGRKVLHVVWRDISERKALEEQLRHSQKMEAIGKLAGGIAHDFNNLLVVIQGYSELLRERVPAESSENEDLKHISEAADRAAGLVRKLLAFGRKQQVKTDVVDVNQAISDSQRLLKPLLGDKIRIAINLWHSPLAVMADVTQLEQVLLNLAANARDAMPGGGTFSIRSRLECIESDEAGTAPERKAVIAVSDDGVGMDEETRRRAFDPFYTTKDVGAGTGLGLATVYGIITQCDGSVSLSSEPGHGTEITISLPVTDEPPSEQRTADKKRRETTGHETILVVEDEPVVSRLVASTLRRAGFRVFTASDGREGVSLYTHNHSDIDLILSDVMMPAMGGPQLVAELDRKGFHPEVLFMSGYSDDALKLLNDLDMDVDLVEKPFKPDQLVGRVKRALQRAAPAPS